MDYRLWTSSSPGIWLWSMAGGVRIRSYGQRVSIGLAGSAVMLTVAQW